MRKIALSVLLASSLGAVAQQPGTADSVFIRKVANNILVDRTMYSNLHYLTKQIGGRLAGSPQMVMAEKWGEKAMQAAGADKVELQECMVPHWVRGGKDKAIVSFSDKGKRLSKNIEVLALGNSLGSGAKGVKAPVIEVHSFDELEQQKNNIKGKIVFYNVPFEETFVETFQAYGKNVKYRGQGASRAAKYGAVAVLIRSMSHSVDNHPHTGAMGYDTAYPKIPAAAVGLRDVEWLDSLYQKQQGVEAQLFTYGKMLPDTIGHSVIGELTGSDFPNQVITVGGHLDSWDVNEGANDDGTGVVQTIEVLRAFKAMGFKPKHTIRFVLFANEENGSRGGKKYAETGKAKGEQHIFALESDEGGFTPRGFGFTVPDKSWEKIQAWKPLFTPYYGDQFTRGGGGTDIEPLAAAMGTPMAGLRPDSQRYFDIHHSANDVLENVNIREVKLGAINMAALLYLVDQYGL
ncbi:MAG: M20/M25/M40 family metallo-hydrolase [Filimonas sp.]|nr:M20/M25/M40 family metallo-hydrolase [Filimonas sp.]